MGDTEAQEIANASLVVTLLREVSEMKGMIRESVSSHALRISSLEVDRDTHERRLNDKSKTLAGLVEHNEHVDFRLTKLEISNDGRMGKIYGAVGAIVGVLGLAVAFFNRITLTGG